MIERQGPADRVLAVLTYVFLTAFSLFCLLPFWIMVVASLTDDMVLRIDGYLPWARQWSLEAYRWVLKGTEIQVGYKVSVFVALVGTLGSLIVISGLAYAMAARRFRARNKVAFYTFFTMIFIPPMVPWFITCRNVLHLRDNVFALILPMMVQPFWVFVLRNFFTSLPEEVLESACIDGATDADILYRIVLPLSTPAIATVGLFTAVAYWNDWFLAVMLLDFAPFRPLAVIIMRMISNIAAMQTAMQQPGVMPSIDMLPSYAIRMATASITIGPIILAYPFVQRYFVKGMILGAIKG
jgi:putative aldouronate transport system permease protein